MKRKYDIYEPSRLIRDFYSSPDSYYMAKDVRLSPFTRIGTLVEASDPTPRVIALRDNTAVKPMHTPVFSSDFVLPGGQRSRQRLSRVAETGLALNNTAKERLEAFLLMIASLLANAVHTTARVVRHPVAALSKHHPDHKYVLNEPTNRHAIKHTLALAEGTAVALVIIFLILMAAILRMVTPNIIPHTGTSGSGPSATNASSQTSSGHGNTPSPTKNAVQQTTGINGTFTPSPQSASGLPSTSTATLIGGMGAGPTTTTSPTPTTSNIAVPGVTSPLPVTVPGQTVPLDGKQVVGTSPTTITLN